MENNDLKQQWKVFNDPVHGHLTLHPLLIKIIDTPQFQRLRYIKQLGGAYFVYPGASHNRFEHSIGVGYLAGQLLQSLRTQYQLERKINITERDILCVQIAGLCHDLGHGPFSHLFDGMFLTEAGKEIKHESLSLKMFDHLVKCNNLEAEMMKHGLKPSEDLDFIKDMIDRPKAAQGQVEPRPYEDRLNNMSFLMDIVSNKRNGIDVDKWDYLARDCYHLGIKNNFDYHRLINFTRVCEVDGQMQICFRDKEVDNLYNMFHARYCLHRRACQHRVTISIQLMIKDAFIKADKHIQVEGSGGKKFTLSKAIDDMEAYTKLTDRVFEEILHSSSAELKDAREILNRILQRKLYKCLAEMQIEKTSKGKIPKWNKELSKDLSRWLTPDDFELHGLQMDYGMEEEDPINNTYFYTKETKENLESASKIAEDLVPRLLPKRFSEYLVRFYYKKADDSNHKPVQKVVEDRFKKWRAELQAEEEQRSATPGNKKAGDEK